MMESSLYRPIDSITLYEITFIINYMSTIVKIFNRKNHLEIQTSNGETISLDAVQLRMLCPCSLCNTQKKTETTKSLRIIDSVIDSCEIVALQPVGNYALKIVFSDGHSSGIYSFDYLNQLISSNADSRS